ncbi:hypothetical protein VC83_01265 [Pseudogymnoascus destructans]|uniref:Centrosomin N-terminal motif 1 domain-containing protein n=2 Tax=Pseudogymnoascus destructans TaxID=655981 RepID=L8G8T2_PSED2|nr:uncharacterized protein VC83_01265 [Pseudogymnoascus destructans]ELR08446.1 hypothetical protein GMDG_00510 [Pseudogymnoascus destructans 20631-21]OAF62737.1 hypothetical protein VC83_01265 [Pseudogymnoascus destructans]
MDTRGIDRHPTPERTRPPGSSTSLQSRGTAGSSNISSSNLPHHRIQNIRSDRGKMHDAAEQGGREGQGQGGDLLQEKLREMKAARLHERRKSRDAAAYQDMQLGSQSSPAGPRRREQELEAPGSADRRADRASGKQKLGVKATEDRVSALLNENFDLKLKLHHRKEQQSKLEERLEDLEQQVKQQHELQGMNEQLVSELAKRDVAIEQAVNVIIELEEKVDKLMEERNAVRSLQAATSLYLSDRDDSVNGGTSSGTNGQIVASSPPDDPRYRANNDITPVGHRSQESHSRSLARMPSFLSEQTEETEALRSLYIPRDQSLPRLSEDHGAKGDDMTSELDGMNSPRLSVLSESSFISVYGAKSNGKDLDSLDLEYENLDSPEPNRFMNARSVDQWVGDGLKNANMMERKESGRVPGVVAVGQFLSMNDVLKSPLQRLEKLQRTLESRNGPAIAARLIQSTSDHKLDDPPRSVPAKQDNIRRTDLQPFEQRALPPTPDTFSTNSLQQYKNSNSTDTLNADATSFVSSTQEHDDNRPYLSRAQTSPEYDLARLRRPRSAAETITSRRDGHGWDTATQSEVTETNSDIASEATSTMDPWISAARENLRPATFRAPEMFSFGEDYKKDWGRDVMFNRRDDDIPIRSRKPLEAPANNDITPTIYRYERSASGYTKDPHASLAAQIETSYRPAPPERRSSLATATSPAGNEKRLRRLQAARAEADAPEPPPHGPKAPPQKTIEDPQKRGLFKMLGLGRSVSAAVSQMPPPAFMRGNSEQPPITTNNISAPKRITVVEDIRDTSATPPPISRYPRGRATADAQRPSTSHSMESRGPSSRVHWERRLSTGHVAASPTSGTLTTDGSEGTGILETGMGGRDIRDTASTRTRRWYALGRVGSLRR